MGWLFLLALIAGVGFVLWRGGSEERLLVAVLALASIVTFTLFKAGHRFGTEPGLFLLNECAVLAVALTVAFRSSRFWPLPYAALQTATVLSLLSTFFAQDLVTYGLGVMQGFWAYPQLLILVWATIRLRATPARS